MRSRGKKKHRAPVFGDFFLQREARAACANHTEELEFCCTHGVGHPTKVGVKAGYDVHGCDGCCSKRYLIHYAGPDSKTTCRGLWWDSSCGWGSKKAATLFTAEEKEKFSLPVGGEWVEVPRRKK